ncbi:uncharacterized protein LOC127464285 isoform X2 [Manacus candei]|uniref:uncharacterized protein LOC127464285 isoform X2 n=1 Tax=Manacus candei TaxID=415023 RepID=UPI0022270D30|nr:uncharacterized protein LOC127464285 isoform X2 [Manacus candei]
MEFPGARKTGWEWSWNTWEGDTGLSPRAEKSWIPSFSGLDPGFPWTHPCPGMLQRARGTMIPKPWSSLEPGKQAGNGPGTLGKVTLVCHLERRRRAGSRVSLDEILVFLGHIPALGYSRGQGDNDPKAMEFPGAGKTGWEWSWNTWEGDTGLSPRAEKSWIPSFPGFYPGFPWTHPCPGMLQRARGTMIPKPWSSLEPGKQAGNGPGILGKVTLVCHLERRRAGSQVSLDWIPVFLGHIPALGYSRGQRDNDLKAMEFPGAGKTGNGPGILGKVTLVCHLSQRRAGSRVSLDWIPVFLGCIPLSRSREVWLSPSRTRQGLDPSQARLWQEQLQEISGAQRARACPALPALG